MKNIKYYLFKSKKTFAKGLSKEKMFFETSVAQINFARGTTQIAAKPPPLSDSDKSYALTQQSREGSSCSMEELSSFRLGSYKPARSSSVARTHRHFSEN